MTKKIASDAAPEHKNAALMLLLHGQVGYDTARGFVEINENVIANFAESGEQK